MCPNKIKQRVFISNNLDMYPKAEKAANEVIPLLEKKSKKYRFSIGPEIKWDRKKQTFRDTGRLEVSVVKRRTRGFLDTASLILKKNNGKIFQSWQDFLAIGVPCHASTKEHSVNGIIEAASNAIASAAQHKIPIGSHIRKSFIEAGQVFHKIC